MSNKSLMAIVIVLLIGILAVVAMQYNENRKTPGEKVAEGISEAIDDVGASVKDVGNEVKNMGRDVKDSVREGVEEIGDEIDDHTRAP